MRFVQEKKGLRQDGFAGKPRQGSAGKVLSRPDVIFFPRVQQGDQCATVNDASAWHGCSPLVSAFVAILFMFSPELPQAPLKPPQCDIGATSKRVASHLLAACRT